MTRNKNIWLVAILFSLAVNLAGCKKSSVEEVVPETSSAAESQMSQAETNEVIKPLETLEIAADDLLAMQLPADQLADGWVRLFDGQSLFGWFVVGQANWRIEDGVIKVDRGEKSYLCSSFLLSDYELMVDFRCDANTNSGIFLRTGPEPMNVAEDCLELNIAPPDNPFPTGSFVERQKLDPADLGRIDTKNWHTYRVRLIDDQVEVFLDDKLVMEMDDFQTGTNGHISLQHNSGRVEFRNVLLRPVNSQPLKLDQDWQDDWTKSEKDNNQFDVEPTENGLQLSGGLGQLQSKKQYGDFILQARYTLARPEVNSGIFFRCMPDTILDGYECQVNHAVVDGDPLRPGDAGAGAIFRRQPARIVVGDGTTPTYITLLANGPQMITWINGIQVADFVDKREADENPRRGLRLDAGPIALQGHDSTTEVIFHSMTVSEL